PTSAAVAELAQPADRLHPAEDLFNPFPRALTDRVARMTCRARIERATVLLLRDVGRGRKRAQRLHEAVRVVAFVTADRHAPARRAARRPGPPVGSVSDRPTLPAMCHRW